MTKEPKNIPLMIALEYMQKVNNLLNHLIREDNFPAILFAKYDDTFHELLRIAQVVNYKYAGTCNPDMEDEALKFLDNIEEWEKEYRTALKSDEYDKLGLTDMRDKPHNMRNNDEFTHTSNEISHMEDRVKSILGQDLFDQVMDRMSSKGREAALSQLMKDMIDKGDLDEEMAN